MNPFRTAKRFAFPLLGLWILLYASFSLLKPPLLDGPDGVTAESAREMASTGDWIIPHINGVRATQTWPLLTWLTAISFRAVGVSDYAARLPLAFCALALFVLIFSFACRLFLTPIAAFYAALILITSCGIFLFAHLLYPAMLLTLWVTLALYCFWRSLRHPTLPTSAAFGAACALGFLSAGLIGIVLPFGIVVLFLFYSRNFRHLARWYPAAGIGLFLLILIPWITLVYRAAPHHAFVAFVPHIRKPPLLLFWFFVLVWITPWFLFAFAALRRLSPRLFTRDARLDPIHDHDQQALLLCVLWAGFTIALYSFSGRQEYYSLPALPAIALLAARWLSTDEKHPSRAGVIIGWILFIGGILKCALLIFLAVRAPAAPPAAAWHEPDIGPLLHLHQHRLFFGPIIDLTLASMGAFRVPLLITAAAIAVGVTANLIFRLKGRIRLANCFIVGMMVFFLIAAHLALNTFSPVVSSAILAEAIKPEVGDGDIVVINGSYEDASALPFYLERQVRLLNRRPDVLAPWSYAPDAPPIFLDNSALAELWTSDTRVFVWTPSATPPSLPGQSYVIARSGGREILSNQPNQGGAFF
ncbi:MAG: glycosyltransferase family 39 protein [Silvibacterium sp.]|nr:glycosyltransferase family 39 protein [Silvibacterium sp.]